MAEQVQRNAWRFPRIAIGQATEIHRRRVALTAAQILTLHSVPVNVVPNPGGTSKVNVFKGAVLEFTVGSSLYLLGGAVSPVYTGTTVDLSGDSIAASVFLSASSSLYRLSEIIPGTGQVLTANKGIDLYAATQDFTTGNGTLVAVIEYETYTLG